MVLHIVPQGSYFREIFAMEMAWTQTKARAKCKMGMAIGKI